MTGWTTAFLVTASLCGQAASAPPANKVLAEQIARLVIQLDAPTLAAREAAEVELLQLGPAALAHLPGDDDATLSAEARKRLARVRSGLEQLETERLTQASTVTLDGQPHSLAEVLAQIQTQTGNALIDYRERFGQEVLAKKVTLALDGVPFWQAIDQLLDHTEMSLYAFAGEPALALIERGPTSRQRLGVAHYQGAFRFEPIMVLAERQFREAGSHRLDLRIEVAWEPRLNVIALKQPLANITAVCSDGSSIKLGTDAVGELEFATPEGSNAVEFDLNLAPPSRDVAAINSLEGTLFALLAIHEHDFRFEQLATARDVRQRHNEATVTLEQVRKNQDAWEVRMRISFDDPAAALESHRGWIFNNRAVLLAPDGAVVEPSTFETTRRTETEVGVAYLFDLPGGIDRHTFVYHSATAIRSLPTAYRLHDIELP
ncbi:MAG: hypothetical protein K1X74_18125 [Pirellulales bacterium]|nr:hypothetical protein [Pirellulales bacterium]